MRLLALVSLFAIMAPHVHAGAGERAVREALKGTRGVEKVELIDGKPAMLGGNAYPVRLLITVNRLYDAAHLRAAVSARLAKVDGLPTTLVVVKEPSGVVHDRFPLGVTRDARGSGAARGLEDRALVGADGRNAAIKLLHPASGATRAIVSTGREEPILALGRSDGSLLAVQGERVLELDARALRLRPAVDLKGTPRLAAIATGAPVVAFVAEDGMVRLQDVRDGRVIFAVDPGIAVDAIAIAAGGSAIAASGDGVLRLWETASRVPRWSTPAERGSLSFEGDAVVIATLRGRELRDAKTGARRVAPARAGNTGRR